MKTYAEYEVLLPEYSLSYLINGDSSGLEEVDIKKIDRWLEHYNNKAALVGGSVVISIDTYAEEYEIAEQELINALDDDWMVDGGYVRNKWKALKWLIDCKDEYKEPYFSIRPEFGLPCNVYDAHVVILVNEEN